MTHAQARLGLWLQAVAFTGMGLSFAVNGRLRAAIICIGVGLFCNLILALEQVVERWRLEE